MTMEAKVEMSVKAWAIVMVLITVGISGVAQGVIVCRHPLVIDGKMLATALPAEIHAVMLLQLEIYFASRSCINPYPDHQQLVATLMSIAASQWNG